MRQLEAFTKKEWMEVSRNSKCLILGILFVLFGIMNPAFAKLTPWIMENMADALESSGFIVTEVNVTALDAWVQFYKNIPMALIIFLIMFSGIVTVEYQKGTLINMVTKGLVRWNVMISKMIVMVSLWTLGYWTCFGITYVYSEYFWENDIAKNLLFSVTCVYLLGVWLITLLLVMSALFSNNTSVMIGTAAVYGILYVIGMLSKVEKYLPVKLMEVSGMPAGTGEPKDYTAAILVTLILIVANMIVAVGCFNRREL